ncbi:MAG: RidA family protein [Rhodospirillales bacterium]|nr:RidA family protein [Rhodospirillales bacterium]
MIAKAHNPPSLHPPFSAYSLGMEVSGAERWLHLSGQVGVRKDGSIPPDAEGQMEECWAKIFAILDAAGMEKANMIKVTGYVTRSDDIGLFRQVRDRLMEGHEPASTLVVVAGLANPDWIVEIEAVAAA